MDINNEHNKPFIDHDIEMSSPNLHQEVEIIDHDINMSDSTLKNAKQKKNIYTDSIMNNSTTDLVFYIFIRIIFIKF